MTRLYAMMNISTESKSVDQVILESTKGELKGFDDLYESYAFPVRALLFKLCNPQDLDDLVQEAFVKIWRGLNRFKGKSSLKTWIFRVVYNLAQDHLRHRMRNKPPLMLIDNTVSSSESMVEAKDVLRVALNELSFEHRSVLVLHWIENVPVNELSNILGSPEGTIKSRLHHAKNKLYAVLKAKGVEL